ncbi:hypothetical protein PG991_009331 [Apiospora marii]|uniref:Uncharacterized protein n=1 Tax=Apiospora marii TaxID=335849 RepID=A0ABR1RKM9_9PEZI
MPNKPPTILAQETDAGGPAIEGRRGSQPRCGIHFVGYPARAASLARSFAKGRPLNQARAAGRTRSPWMSGIIRDLDPVLMAYDDKERIDKVSSIVDDEERAKQAVGWAWSGDDVVSDKVSDEASDDEII